MLKVIAALLLVVLCVKSQTPRLWGSQVVTQKSGPVTLCLEPPISPSDCYVAIYPNDDDRYTLKINTKTKECTYWHDSPLSAPCDYDKKKFQVTIRDVTALEKLTIRSKKNDTIFISVIFAPYCKFAVPTYVSDQVVPQESAPLSKFVKGQKVVPIRFAIRGTASQSEVKLFRNGQLLCQWKGIVFVTGNGCGSEYLRPDYEKNIRVFRRNYSVPSTRDYYEFVGPKNSLSVTVDGQQAGESPEMTDCESNRMSPKLWGSQVITRRSGSVTLNLEPQGNPDRILIMKGALSDAITIDSKTKKCVNWRGTEWSAPCSYDKTKLQITVKDVTAQDKILIYSPEPHFSQISVVFAPGCKFPTLKEDELIAKESAPLTKFVLEQMTVPITFALMGSNSQSEVKLSKNGQILCSWKGIRYEGGDGCGRVNLIKDDVNNMRVFKGDFPVPPFVDFYAFHTPNSELFITVDATQSGESPEMADCQNNLASPKLWGSQIVTHRTGPVTLNLEPQGSPDRSQILALEGDRAETITIDTKTNKCVTWQNTEWGAPCSYDKTKLVLTVNDVTTQSKLLIASPKPYNTQISVVFAPGCKFAALQQDEVVPKESAPLSRFVLGKITVPLTFAVMGSDSQSEVKLWKNGELLCIWKGIKYESGDGCDKKDLEKDDVNNMRVLKKDYPVPPFVDFYAWSSPNSELAVTVDATQAGESKEMADC